MVLTGLEVLKREGFKRLAGKRVGVLTNPSAVDNEYRHILPLLLEAEVDVRLIFAPEHGLDAATPYLEKVNEETDDTAGRPIRVVSLYGDSFESLKPRPEDLAEIDLLLFDIQDVGARYYTFVWTMALALRECAQAGVTLMVLDRPNPINGEAVEGAGLPEPLRAFVGLYEIPNRHGLTAGEIAHMVAGELRADGGDASDPQLEIVQMEGWQRPLFHNETGAPWVPPSPNIPTPDTALLYPGMCLIEGTNLSEGRGTAMPFHLVGAPFCEGRPLRAELEKIATEAGPRNGASQNLDGIRFRELSTRPIDDKWAGDLIGGVQLHVTDRRALNSFRLGLAVIAACWRLWPSECAWRTEEYEFRADVPALDLLTGVPALRPMFEAGAPIAEIWDAAESTAATARKCRNSALLY